MTSGVKERDEGLIPGLWDVGREDKKEGIKGGREGLEEGIRVGGGTEEEKEGIEGKGRVRRDWKKE